METICSARLKDELHRRLLPLTGRAANDGAPSDHSKTFAALPSAADARLLVPIGARRCAVSALDSYCPNTRRSQLLKQVTLALVRVGWHGGAQQHVELPFHPSGAVPRLLKDLLGESELTFALLIGSPGALRKCVLQAMRPNGDVLAYVKVPLTEAAGESVRYEAFVIAHLTAFESMQGCVPQVLYAGECERMHILVEAPGPTGRSPFHFGRAHEEFLRRLAAVHPVTLPGEEVANDVAALLEESPRVHRNLRAVARRALHVATDALRGIPVPCGLIHGDFAPWNMRRRNPLYVFDWERARYNTPVVWDKFHFNVQSACLLHRRVTPAERYLDNPDSLLALYLISSICNITAEHSESHIETEYRGRLLSRQIQLHEARTRSIIVTPLETAPVLPSAAAARPSADPANSPRRLPFGSKGVLKLLSWARQSLFALSDQALTSGANFLMSILLARYVGAEQYGQYALAFTLFLLLSLLHQALILEPVSVFGGAEYKRNFRNYGSALLRFHAVVAPATAVVLAILGAVVREWSPGLSVALEGTACAAPCILLLWFARRLMYNLESPFRAAVGAAVYCSVLFGVLYLVLPHGLHVFTAFLIMGIAALAGSLPLLLWFSRCQTTGPPVDLRHILRKHWTYGKWTVASSIAMWLPWNAYYTLLTVLRTAPEAGALKALLNLAQIVFQMYGAMSLLLLPYAAATCAKQGITGSETLGRRIMWVFAAGSVFYWILLTVFRDEVLKLLYRGNYAEVSPLIPWIGLACVLWGAAQGPGIALRGANSPRTVFYAYLGASVVTVVVGIPATWAFGIRGVAAALILSNGTALAISARLLRRYSIQNTAAGIEQATAA